MRCFWCISRVPYTPCAKCSRSIPPTAIIDGKRRSLNRRKYCLECSPFGQRNTRKLDGSGRQPRCDSKLHLLPKAIELYAAGNSLRTVGAELDIGPSTIELWAQKGLIPTRTHAEAMALASAEGRMRGAEHWTDESRAKQRAHMLRRIEEDPMNHPNRKLAGNRKKMSYPERLVFDVLTEAGIIFQHNPPIDRYFPDFVIGQRIFEVDGERWHDAAKDAIRDKRLTELGYTVERFKAKEIVKNPRIILHRLQVL